MRRHTGTLIMLIVVAVLILGTRGSFGLFISPWEEQFGVGRGLVSLISATGFLTYGLAQPIAGRWLERWSPRLVIGAGLLLVATGLVAAAVSSTIWMVVISIGLVASFGTGMASLSALSYVAGELVEGEGGMVFGFLTAGAAGGQVVILPIATVALGVSLKASLLTIAALCLAGAIAVGLRVPDLPARAGSELRTPVSEMAKQPRFWLLLLPFFICGYTTSGMIETHLIPFALDHHIEQATASAALATLAAFNIAGVLLAGGLTDRVNRGAMLGWIYLLRAATLLILPLISNATGLFVFGALFGIADYATVPPTTSLTRTVFRTGGWAVAIGIISAAHQLGSALGAWLPGVIFEAYGSYSAAFVSGAVTLVLAALLSFLLSKTTTEPAGISIGV